LNQNRALGFCFDAFFSREPAATSLENAITANDPTSTVACWVRASGACLADIVSRH
jgi:hypothetical protein